MPIFVLNTNVPRSKIPAGFLKDTCELIGKILGKEVHYCCAHINTDQLLSYAGTDEPAAYGSLSCIGAAIGGDKNVELHKALNDFLEQKLNIKQSRLCIEYRRTVGTEIGFEARILSELK